MVSLDLYTQNIPLTQVTLIFSAVTISFQTSIIFRRQSSGPTTLVAWKVRLWAGMGEFISVQQHWPELPCDGLELDIINHNAGNQDLRANDPNIRNWHPSVIETLPNDYPELKMEFSKLESQMFDRPMRRAYEPLTPVIADANERWALCLSPTSYLLTLSYLQD